MHKIVSKVRLSPNVTRLDVEAARLAQIRRAGQFVIIRRAEGAERIPLTIADSNPAAGTISLIIQAVGKSTRELVALEPGDFIRDIAGPLGHPTELISLGPRGLRGRRRRHGGGFSHRPRLAPGRSPRHERHRRTFPRMGHHGAGAARIGRRCRLHR